MVKGWIESEPGWLEARAELATMVRRASRRVVLTFIITAMLASGVTYMKSKRARTFSSEIVIQLEERRLEAATAPVSARTLKDHIYHTIFADKPLLELIHRFHLYPSFRELDPGFAADRMRDDIGLTVVRDYFRQADTETEVAPLRSARVKLSYRAIDPETALVVARALGELVVNTQTEERQTAVTEVFDSFVGVGITLRANLSQARFEAARSLSDFKRAPEDDRVALLLKYKRAVETTRSIEGQVALTEGTKSRLRLRKAFEDEAMGLSFDWVDRGRLAPIPLLSVRQELVFVGMFAVLLCLPIAVIVAGTFDRRLRDLDGLRRLGIKGFTRVPHFPGSAAGSLADRQRRAIARA